MYRSDDYCVCILRELIILVNFLGWEGGGVRERVHSQLK